MDISFFDVYQHFPQAINPIAFSIGFVSIRWYALMYLLGFFVTYWLLRRRIRKKEFPDSLSRLFGESQNLIVDFFLYAITGLIIGGRLGYVIFYDFSYFASNLWAIISPYDFATGKFIGIYGMSYYGGLLGVVLASVVFSGKYKLDFWQLADFIVPAVPAGYFFGRLGNFLNGELYGKATSKIWGMYFTSDNLGLSRHPSQLYEAFFEGIVLFAILWALRNKPKFAGYLFCLYLGGYGFFRFWLEFFRQPDENISLIFGFLTIGQIFSFLTVIFALCLYSWLAKKRVVEL